MHPNGGSIFALVVKEVGVSLFTNKKINSPYPVRRFTGSQNHMAVLAAVALGCVIIASYVWFISLGRWTTWIQTTTYYDQLAAAFWQGQTSLLVKPEPSLLSASDPYKIENRNNISYPWDTSFYDGKYYLYWGPAPALVFSAVRLFYTHEIGDQILVFLFVCGTFLFGSMMVLRLRARIFPDLRWPYVIPGILMAGVANPLPWLLNHPAIYEASIAGGQLFLMAGLYMGFVAVSQERLRSWLPAAASICWVLSIASRASLMPVTLLFVLGMGWNILWRPGVGWKKMLALAVLFLPFASGLLGIGWYNANRFGSWFEFGLKYQLTGMDMRVRLFSPTYLLINVYNYFLNPYQTLSHFPYVRPYPVAHSAYFQTHTPANYCSEYVSGVIPTVPYVLLAAIVIYFLLQRAYRGQNRSSNNSCAVRNRVGNHGVEWIAIMLFGGSVLSSAPILFFKMGTMRYLGDVIPLLVLLSTLGFFLGVRCFDKPTRRRVFILLVVALVAFSCMVSLLLAVTGYYSLFERSNPALFYHLVRLLSP